MTRYWATIEFISDRAAIVTLYDEAGEWSGAGRIEVKTRNDPRSALYENGYICAAASATSKGGALDRFSVLS